MTKPSQQHRGVNHPHFSGILFHPTTLYQLSTKRKRKICLLHFFKQQVWTLQFVCLLGDWRICRTISARDILSEKINFFVLHVKDPYTGMDGHREGFKNKLIGRQVFGEHLEAEKRFLISVTDFRVLLPPILRLLLLCGPGMIRGVDARDASSGQIDSTTFFSTYLTYPSLDSYLYVLLYLYIYSYQYYLLL